MMSIDPKMVEVLEQHSFASMMGSLSVVTFTEGDHRESFAFVDGLPVPYNRFCANVTASLFRHSPDIGRDCKVEIDRLPKIDPLSSFWSRIKLSPAARAEHDPFQATRMVETRVRALIQTHCTSKFDDVRREELGGLIDRIETEFMESLNRPIEVTGLSRIYDFPTEDKALAALVQRLELKEEALDIKRNLNKKFGAMSQKNDSY
jgi:hypothetical protein